MSKAPTKVRSKDVRVIRRYQEYPGSYVWTDCEYRCPECNKWHTSGGDVTQDNDDGTYSILCKPCGEKVFPPDSVPCEHCGEPEDAKLRGRLMSEDNRVVPVCDDCFERLADADRQDEL